MQLALICLRLIAVTNLIIKYANFSQQRALTSLRTKLLKNIRCKWKLQFLNKKLNVCFLTFSQSSSLSVSASLFLFTKGAYNSLITISNCRGRKSHLICAINTIIDPDKMSEAQDYRGITLSAWLDLAWLYTIFTHLGPGGANHTWLYNYCHNCKCIKAEEKAHKHVGRQEIELNLHNMQL